MIRQLRFATCLFCWRLLREPSVWKEDCFLETWSLELGFCVQGAKKVWFYKFFTCLCRHKRLILSKKCPVKRFPIFMLCILTPCTNSWKKFSYWTFSSGNQFFFFLGRWFLSRKLFIWKQKISQLDQDNIIDELTLKKLGNYWYLRESGLFLEKKWYAIGIDLVIIMF